MYINEPKKIKTCPFCGSKVRLVKNVKTYCDSDSHIADEFYIACDTCGVKTVSYQSDIYSDIEGNIITRKNGALDAIKSWNQRVDDRWIPVSVELPKDKEDVLLYIEGKSQQGIYVGYIDKENPIKENKEDKTYGGVWHVKGWGYFEKCEPLAWMSSPELFRNDEEDW